MVNKNCKSNGPVELDIATLQVVLMALSRELYENSDINASHFATSDDRGDRDEGFFDLGKNAGVKNCCKIVTKMLEEQSWRNYKEEEE